MKKIVGYTLLASPFVALFIYGVIRNGLLYTVLGFLALIALIGILALAYYLITTD